MRQVIILSLLGTAALLVTGCGAVGEAQTEAAGEAAEFGEVSEALSTVYTQTGADGTMLFNPFTVFQNCTLTVQTTGASATRDPVLGLIINNGNPSAWGSSTTPCRHGTYTATDGYTTLAFGDNITATNYNAKFTYKNTSGGAGLTVFAVGFIKAPTATTNTSFGPLTVNYSITGCTDPTKNTSGSINQDFQTSGAKAAYPGYVYTWEPRPGGPQTQPDTVMFGLDPNVNGSGKCNDDCPAPLGNALQSCISNNSGTSMWFFSTPWFSPGFTSFNN